MDLQEKIEEAFVTHPKEDTFFITADEQIFFTRGNADYHAQKLRDRGVAKVERQTLAAAKAAAEAAPVAPITHPESFPPSAEDIARKQKADDDAQTALNAKLNTGKKATPPASAVIDTTAAEKAAADKAAAKLEEEKKMLADKEAADKAAADKAANDKAAIDEANKKKADAEKAVADRAAIDKAAVDKAAAEKAAADKAAAEKNTTNQA